MEHLAASIVELAGSELSPEIRTASERLLLNVAAAAVAGSGHSIIDRLVLLSGVQGGEGTAAVIGRDGTTDAYFSALIAGTAARVLNFDDTHLATLMSPSAAPFGALVALGSTTRCDGAKVLRAFAIGIETGLRLAISISPGHALVGWDATGTCGVVGAAVTAGLLLDLDAEQLTNAIGIASGYTLGLRESTGSPAATLYAGKAAAGGVMAALLGKRNFTGPASLDLPMGFFTAFTTGDRAKIDAILTGFGERWELLDDTIRPYPCDSLCHPAIDAALSLRPQIGVRRIKKMRLRANPSVAAFVDAVQPRDPLEAAVSVQHGIAAALIDGEAGVAQYGPGYVDAANVAALRGCISVFPDQRCERDAAWLEIECADGESIRGSVDHAHGSATVPLSDGELWEKVRSLLDPSGSQAALQLRDAVGGLSAAQSAGGFIDVLAGGEFAKV